jgi:SNF2 family DNA or RNA helicase
MTATNRISVDLVDVNGLHWLEVLGGDPAGRDAVHTTVSSWAGWKRQPAAGMLEGAPCSRYRARAWTAAVLPLLRSTLQASWSPVARSFAMRSSEALEAAAAALTEKGGSVHRPHDPRSPMPHQVQAVRALEALGNVALLTDDMGLGKTTTSLITWSRSNCSRLLVICPKSVKLNWVEEIKATLGTQVPVHLLDGSPNERANVIMFMLYSIAHNIRAVAIVNYDLLRSMNERSWKTLEQWVHGQALIGDEFHYCKDFDAKRTKSVAALAKLSLFRLGLTGTPVRNTVEDLFSQIEIIRPGTWVGYHDFANRHLVVVPMTFSGQKRPVNVVRGGKNLDELNAVLNTMRVGRKKEDVLNLPPLIHTKPLLELDGVHLQVYKAMKEHAQVELEKLVGPNPPPDEGLETGGELAVRDVTIFHPAARSAVEAAMRCEQIAQGFIGNLPPLYMERLAPMIADKAERVEGYEGALVFPDSAKLVWLMETLESLRDKQPVIFSRFNAPLLWLHKKLEKAALLIGSIDTLGRQQEISAFQAGEKRIMLCQVRLAEGFNLTASSDVIFLGRDWSPAINRQAEARCHRIGSKGTVNVQIPIMQNTVERFIERKLAAKEADEQQALKTVTVKELMEAL